MASTDRLRTSATCVVVGLCASLLVVPLDAQVVGTVDVSVTSGVAASPVAWASVETTGGTEAVSDVRGRALLRGLAPGLHTLVVRAFGFADHSIEVLVENGRVVRVDVSLAPAAFELDAITVDGTADRPAGAVVLRVADADGTVTDLPGLLEQVPGATIVRRGSAGSEATLQLRGGDPDQLLVLLDGVPLNDAGSGVADLSRIDVDALETVVVLPGAQSARYGPRALAGVLLLESRPSRGPRVDARFGAGAWGAAEAGVTATTSLGDLWSASIGGEWAKVDGAFEYEAPAFRGGGTVRRDNARSERITGRLALQSTGPSVRLRFAADMSTTDRGSPGSIAQPSLTGKQSHDRLSAALAGEIGRDARGASMRVSHQSQRSEYRDPTPPFGQAYDDAADVTQTDLAAEAWSRLGRLTLRAGAQGRRLRVEATPLDVSGVRYDEAGVWSEVTSVVDTGLPGALTIRLGLRADYHDLVDDVVLSPAASVEWTIPGLQLGVRHANAFAPPSVSDLFFQEGVLVRANPNLRPERVRGEWSASLTANRRIGPGSLRGEASAWTADVEDMILWFPDFHFVWSPNNFLVTRRGADVSVSLEAVTSGVRHILSGRIGHSRVEYADGGLEGQVAYRPLSTGTLALRTDFAAAAITTRFTRVGARRSVPGSALNSLPAYDEVDAGLVVPVSFSTLDGQLELSVSNLLDRPAALLADYPLPGRSWAVRIRLS